MGRLSANGRRLRCVRAALRAFGRHALLFVLAIGVAVPAAGAEPCPCAAKPERCEVSDAPACCCSGKQAAPEPKACCADAAAPAAAAGCCDSPLSDCDCESCHGPRPADPLSMSPFGDQVPVELSSTPPCPVAPIADADLSGRLAVWTLGCDALRPPDLRALLSVWTL